MSLKLSNQSSIRSSTQKRRVEFMEMTEEQVNILQSAQVEEEKSMYTELESDEKSLMDMVMTPSQIRGKQS